MSLKIEQLATAELDALGRSLTRLIPLALACPEIVELGAQLEKQRAARRLRSLADLEEQAARISEKLEAASRAARGASAPLVLVDRSGAPLGLVNHPEVSISSTIGAAEQCDSPEDARECLMDLLRKYRKDTIAHFRSFPHPDPRRSELETSIFEALALPEPHFPEPSFPTPSQHAARHIQREHSECRRPKTSPLKVIVKAERPDHTDTRKAARRRTSRRRKRRGWR